MPRERCEDAKEVLLAALVDEDWAVRKAAASALSKVAAAHETLLLIADVQESGVAPRLLDCIKSTC